MNETMSVRATLESLVGRTTAAQVALLTNSYDQRELAKRLNSQARGALRSTLCSENELTEHAQRLETFLTQLEAPCSK